MWNWLISKVVMTERMSQLVRKCVIRGCLRKGFLHLRKFGFIEAILSTSMLFCQILMLFFPFVQLSICFLLFFTLLLALSFSIFASILKYTRFAILFRMLHLNLYNSIFGQWIIIFTFWFFKRLNWSPWFFRWTTRFQCCFVRWRSTVHILRDLVKRNIHQFLRRRSDILCWRLKGIFSCRMPR